MSKFERKAGLWLPESALFRFHLSPNRLFILWNAAFFALSFEPLRVLIQTSWHSPYYSYIPFIPFLTAYLLYDNRQNIFSEPQSSPRAAIALACAAVPMLLAAQRETLTQGSEHLWLMTAAVIIVWICGFVVSYGVKAVRAGAFPLLFLFFAVPLPAALLEQVIAVLQRRSADAAQLLFGVSGIPFVRDGMIFHLPGTDIEVAKECSGIRSALSLLITACLAANLFLRSGWSKVLLVVAAVPITILKNGIRIFVLSALGVYVDMKLLTDSALHSRGGILFFIIALLLIGAVIMLLRKAEKTYSAAEATEHTENGLKKIL